jgi:hypothetical protein
MRLLFFFSPSLQQKVLCCFVNYLRDKQMQIEYTHHLIEARALSNVANKKLNASGNNLTACRESDL